MFRSWGRVGTTIGGTKLEDFGDLTEAKESFKFQFADKTGNRWSKRKEFAKKAGKMQGRDSIELILSQKTVSFSLAYSQGCASC